MNVNSGRLFVSFLREICSAKGIGLRTHHGDWLLTLTKENRSEHVFGYDFSLNSAAAHQISKDKAATYSILSDARIPAVEHELVMSPTLLDYMPTTGNWERLRELFSKWNKDMVCKPNDGTGGRDVFRVQNPVHLERAIHVLLSRARGCAVSPYVKVKDEFRVLMLDGNPLLVYRKLRPVVVGDGKRRLIELLADWLKASDSSNSADARLKTLGRLEIDASQLTQIPNLGEIVAINWRHNLGQGANAEELKSDSPEKAELIRLAQQAMNALRLRVASVDIVANAAGHLQVLEVNSGIMMEQFGRESRARALEIYTGILDAVFAPA